MVLCNWYTIIHAILEGTVCTIKSHIGGFGKQTGRLMHVNSDVQTSRHIDTQSRHRNMLTSVFSLCRVGE